jgi:hypothetical protein
MNTPETISDTAYFVLEGQDDPGNGKGSSDSTRLQSLLDSAPDGADIELKGTFNFGSDQFVSMKKDVTIRSSKDGNNKAIVKGGKNSFALGMDPA